MLAIFLSMKDPFIHMYEKALRYRELARFFHFTRYRYHRIAVNSRHGLNLGLPSSVVLQVEVQGMVLVVTGLPDCVQITVTAVVELFVDVAVV